MNWYIGMKVIMKKMDYNEDGKQIDQVDPGLTSNPRIILMMYNFDNDYSTAKEKIEKNFLEFCANGSGCIFDRVDLVSVHIVGYELGPQKKFKGKSKRERKRTRRV